MLDAAVGDVAASREVVSRVAGMTSMHFRIALHAGLDGGGRPKHTLSLELLSVAGDVVLSGVRHRTALVGEPRFVVRHEAGEAKDTLRIDTLCAPSLDPRDRGDVLAFFSGVPYIELIAI
jgi:hypothetical protein